MERIFILEHYSENDLKDISPAIVIIRKGKDDVVHVVLWDVEDSLSIVEGHHLYPLVGVKEDYHDDMNKEIIKVIVVFVKDYS